MLGNILLLIFYFTAPAGILFICRKTKVFNKIGPVLTLYLLGVLVANIGIFPTEAVAHDKLMKFQNSISEVLVPLALPMMLFGCNFKRFSLGKSMGAFALGVLSVVAFVLAGYFVFQNQLGNEGAIMGATLTGQYLGGAANLAAIKQMLGLSTENFVILSTCNLIVSFFYLMFLMGGGVKLARIIVGGRGNKEQNVNLEEYTEDNPYRGFGKKESLIQLGKVLFASVIVMGISVYIGTLCGGGGGISMIALILSITTLSLLLTSWKEVRSWDKSYDAGMYLIYVFCLVMATMADLSTINWSQSLYILIFQAVIIFGSLALIVLLAKLFRIDADTAVITSNTLINSPICVPMIAATMRNKDVIVTGITNGLAGYAVGNYIGFLMFNLLAWI
ncbi:MAG: DUF819 family protein [Bacteroidaceae bacterium]|nr:DUF819 family protein [Bacteroidaceae bacterium]